MAKERSVFVCQSCSYRSAKWLGKCPECGEWNSFVEEFFSSSHQFKGDDTSLSSHKKPKPITEIGSGQEPRISSGIAELDRVLGGGIVAGSMVLIGGDPGIGKSTLLLQAAARVCEQGRVVLYITGEESFHQIRLRGDRLGAINQNLIILAETCLEEVKTEIKNIKPDVIIVDSIQAIFSKGLQTAPGNLSQLREVTSQLMILTKEFNIPTFLIGHVTKEGAIAGPKALEHMVDTVLYFEGDRGHVLRILRAVKNRFGSTNEIGVFDMTGGGLREVLNPSQIFLDERPKGLAGTVVVAALEGTRPIMIELQALVSPTNLITPRRMATGLDSNRVSLLIAVLEKRIGLHLQGEDIFVNVAGGLRLDEPALDLGIAAVITSSYREKAIDPDTVIIGEVGLVGEVRAVPQIEKRLKEAQKLGFKKCLAPRNNLKGEDLGLGLEILEVHSVAQALEMLF